MWSIANEFSQALGRPITYVDVPLDVWKDTLSKMGLPPHVVSHVIAMAELHQANRYDRYSDDVETITGVRPMGVREFVERNAQAFTRVKAE